VTNALRLFHQCPATKLRRQGVSTESSTRSESGRLRKSRLARGTELLRTLIVGALALVSTAASAGFLSLYSYNFGPNQSIIAELGQVSYITGCGAGGIDDFIYPWADVYIVPAGIGAGASLSDVSGTPNTLQYIIIDEVIGYRPGWQHSVRTLRGDHG
jgi:hypothetical protein